MFKFSYPFENGIDFFYSGYGFPFPSSSQLFPTHPDTYFSFILSVGYK